VMATMAFLPTGLLAALVVQALGRTHKAIGGREANCCYGYLLPAVLRAF
jgi:hypothetical protein